MGYLEGSRIKPENYITILGWMVTDLGLKGVELIVYACVYGFSQSGDAGFIGSPAYLAEWANCSRQGVYKVLNNLMVRGLIMKRYVNTGGIDLIQYIAIRRQHSLHTDNSVDTTCQHSLHPTDNSVDTTCQHSLHNNNSNKTNKDISIDSSCAPTPPTVEQVSAYCRERGNGIDAQRFHDFYSLRKWKGKDGSIAGTEDWQRVIRLWETNGVDDKNVGRKEQQKNSASFDTDEMWEDALKRSYGG